MKIHLHLLAAVAALLLAHAARAENIVSNLANATTAQVVLDASNLSYAQAFTTGPEAAPLLSIRFRANSPSNVTAPPA